MDGAVSSQKSGDNATRRNTRSTSNQEKTQEIPDSNKSNSSNSSKDSALMDGNKKKGCDRVERGPNGDVLSYTTEDDVTYRVSDSAYLETERSDAPYSICNIHEIKVSKRDSAIVYVKWYYRPTEVPDLVYQMLIKNRYNQVDDTSIKNLLMNPDVINRELFLDERLEATDSFPITNLKGKCQVSHFTEVSAIKSFDLKPDHFFSICSYSTENRRLASSKGETKVGPSHQWSARNRGLFQKAELPELRQESADGYAKERVYEEMTWEPNVDNCDLVVCLRAARSLAAFAGVCDGVLPEEGCIAAYRDDTTINALRVLFENNGNPRKAIDDLVKNPVPVTIESKWTEEQVKRFQKGLRHHGKNFFRIRKELLPTKETSELVEFYYLSKKSQDNLMIRSHQRKQRRQATLKKFECKPKPASYASGDQTSTEEETESEESEKELNPKCAHCQKSTANDLQTGGKENLKLCVDCRLFFKKYGENRPVISVDEVESANEAETDSSPAPKSSIPPFLFKPIKEEKVNNLIPKKPAKAKVNTPEIKKLTKREWPADIKTEQADDTTPKRPKNESDENDERHNEAAPRQSFLQDHQGPPVTSNVAGPDQESRSYSPPRKILPPVKPRVVPHEKDKFTAPGPTPDETPVMKASESYMPSIGPFVPATQTSQRLAVKPSELEAISKLAMCPGAVTGGRYATVAHAGTSPNQSTLPGPGASTHSPPCATTVTTAIGLRPTASIEQPARDTSRPPPPDTGQEQPTTSRPDHPARPDKSNYKPYPGPSGQRGFPFDPRFMDKIIINANMDRPTVKEEARSSSPLTREVAHASATHVSRESVVSRGIKQEAYHYHQPQHPARTGHSGGAMQPQTSRNPGFPTLQSLSQQPPNHRSAPERFRPPARAPRPSQEGDDSDVEYVRPVTPVAVEIPCSYGHSARFVKTLDRGGDSCFRTDFVFAADEASRKRRQDRQREEMKKPHDQDALVRFMQHKKPATPQPLKVERTREEPRPEHQQPRQRRDSAAPPAQSGQNHPGQYRSSSAGRASVSRSTPTTSAGFDQHHRPPSGAFAPPGAGLGPDMSALQHLRNIANMDAHRHAMAAEAGMQMGQAHPLYQYYRLAGVDPEMAERERLAKLGELKSQEMMSQNLAQLHPSQLAALHGMQGQHMPTLEQLHQYQAQILNSLPPGAHPSSLATPHVVLAAAQLSEAYNVERLNFERMQAERLAAEQQYQLELLHHHSHSHVHSHLHLHGPSQTGGPPPAGGPLPLPGMPPPGPGLGDPLLNPYAAMQAMNPMNPLVLGANPLLTQSMIRNQQAAVAQAALMQQSLAAPHLSAIAAREQAAAAASQPHPFSQHLQAFNEQHVMESQHRRAAAAAALHDQQYLAHLARFKQ